jgi:hypothetical protein
MYRKVTRVMNRYKKRIHHIHGKQMKLLEEEERKQENSDAEK